MQIILEQDEISNFLTKEIEKKLKNIYINISREVLKRNNINDAKKYKKSAFDDVKQQIEDKCKSDNFFMNLKKLKSNLNQNNFNNINASDALKEFLFKIFKSQNQELTEETFKEVLAASENENNTLAYLESNTTSDDAVKKAKQKTKETEIQNVIKKLFKIFNKDNKILEFLQIKTTVMNEVDLGFMELNFSDILGTFKSDKKIQIRKFIELLVEAFDKGFAVRKTNKFKVYILEKLKEIEINDENAIQTIVNNFPSFWKLVIKRGNTDATVKNIEEELAKSLNILRDKIRQRNEREEERYKNFLNSINSKNYELTFSSRGDETELNFEFKNHFRKKIKYTIDSKEYIVNINNAKLKQLRKDNETTFPADSSNPGSLTLRKKAQAALDLEEQIIKIIKPLLKKKIKRKQNGKKNLCN